MFSRGDCRRGDSPGGETRLTPSESSERSAAPVPQSLRFCNMFSKVSPPPAAPLARPPPALLARPPRLPLPPLPLELAAPDLTAAVAAAALGSTSAAAAANASALAFAPLAAIAPEGNEAAGASETLPLSERRLLLGAGSARSRCGLRRGLEHLAGSCPLVSTAAGAAPPCPGASGACGARELAPPRASLPLAAGGATLSFPLFFFEPIGYRISGSASSSLDMSSMLRRPVGIGSTPGIQNGSTCVGGMTAVGIHGVIHGPRSSLDETEKNPSRSTVHGPSWICFSQKPSNVNVSL